MITIKVTLRISLLFLTSTSCVLGGSNFSIPVIVVGDVPYASRSSIAPKTLLKRPEKINTGTNGTQSIQSTQPYKK